MRTSPDEPPRDPMATDTAPLIIRTASADEAKAILRRFGADHLAALGIGDYIAARWPVVGVRELARRIGTTTDPDLPDRPAKVAAALADLCDRVEAEPPNDW